MRASSPNVMAWVARMVSPKAEGPFEPWPALAPTLMPLLKEEVAAFFLPWSAANAAAIARGDKTFEMTVGGAPWTQEPQKYHARSLAETSPQVRSGEERTRARGDPRGKRLPPLSVVACGVTASLRTTESSPQRRHNQRCP